MLNSIMVLSFFIAHDNAKGFRVPKISKHIDNRRFLLQSPCPDVFQYRNDEQGDLVGTIKVDPINFEGELLLEVEFILSSNAQGYNGKIVLLDDKERVIENIMKNRPIFYRLLFPSWNSIAPKITTIFSNGHLICRGPRIPIQMVPVLTTINLQHKLSLGMAPLNQPPHFNFNIDNNEPRLSTFGYPNRSQNPLSVRVSSITNITNRIFTESSKSSSEEDSSFKSFLNVNNPFNFNPPPDNSPPPFSSGPGERPPPPDEGPPRRAAGRFSLEERQPPQFQQRPYHPQPAESSSFSEIINPHNPFLNGLSTPEPLKHNAGIQNIGSNPFFSQRTETSSTSTEPTSPSIRGGSAESTITTNSLNEICGRPLPTTQLIFNGQSVPRGAFPWLVAIFQQLDNLSVTYICSGSLISEKHVVTAAHCVKSEYRRVKPNEIVCILGKLNIRRWTTLPGEQILEPESIAIHPDYESGKANGDIAIITFAEPIVFSQLIMPVCLWQGNNELHEIVGDIGTVVGWGRDENGDVSTAEPKQVNMPVVDQFECLKGSGSTAGQALVEIVSKNTFCAGFRNGSGPCNGDSGSAFLLKRNNVFYLRGVVSTALSEATHRTCNLKEYVVFTDASKCLDWIMNILKR